MYNLLRKFRLNLARKTQASEDFSKSNRHRQLLKLDAMMRNITLPLGGLTVEIEILLHSFEPFIARRVKQLSGRELEARANRAKETVELYRDLDRKFYGQTILPPRRTFREYVETKTPWQKSNRKRRKFTAED